MYRLVGVRSDGAETTLAQKLTKQRAEAVKTSLSDPRIFAEIRVIPEEGCAAPVLLIDNDPDRLHAERSGKLSLAARDAVVRLAIDAMNRAGR
jgi:hypothetical protein